MTFDLTSEQCLILETPLETPLFVRGPAGCGKTTAAIARALRLLTSGLPAESLLILTPQRTLQTPYRQAIFSAGFAGGQVTFATLGGLARRTCELFWPLAAERAGFYHPDRPPTFLTLETAQYYMAHLVRPKLEQGTLFPSITIDRNRLYAQILDNLNKAAVVGFDYREIGERLSSAWTGDPAQFRIYADAQTCATLFRQYCLEHNLLDFSLQVEVFLNVLWPDPLVRHYLIRTYRHLIYDNLEEDVPRAHDLMREWLPHFDSALLIYDEGGGYRQFLGGDPVTAASLQASCSQTLTLERSLVTPPALQALATSLERALIPLPSSPPPDQPSFQDALFLLSARYYPELLDAVVVEIARLLREDSLPASEIVILAPYLSDSLRFAITQRLEQAGIPWRSHRPSRALRDEPASQALVTLAALAHPAWDIHPTYFDVAYAFLIALQTDLVRAKLLAEIVYRPRDLRLSPFETIGPAMQERITYALGERYTALRNWLLAYRQTPPLPLDHFWRKLFGEVLSQPGFGFHTNLDAVRVAASLIESVQKFRHTLEETEDAPTDELTLGREYLSLLQDGVIAAQYLEAWQTPPQVEAVLVAPAYTFLMMNQPVSVQFWLDPGSAGWVERIAQPLTQPYVLSRHWPPGRLWTDADEVQVEIQALVRLVRGLLARCRQRLYLAIPDLSETGFEQRGVLLRAVQRVLQESLQAK